MEQIGHEEEALKVLHALEAEGWMKELFPAWTAAKADEEKLKSLHELAVSLALQGVHPDMSAAQMQLLTAKLAAKDVAALKKMLLRPGFVEEWNSLDSLAAGFSKVLLAKENATPSISFKLFTNYDPEAILWLGFTSKDAAVQDRFNLFLKVWPEARQRIPHALMQEMRITPELATYSEIVQSIFLELIDGRLTTPEEMRAFLEPYSPPAPPPQVTVKRPRAKRGEAKIKEHFDDEDEESDDDAEEDEDLDDIGGDSDEDEIGLSLNLPKSALGVEAADEADSADEDLDETEPASAKRGAKVSAASDFDEDNEPVSKTHPAKSHSKPAAKPAPVPAAKHAAVKPAPVPASKKAAPAKPAPTPVKPAAKTPAAPHKAVVKAPVKAAPAAKPAKATGAKAAAAAKPAPKKAAHAPAKKR